MHKQLQRSIRSTKIDHFLYNEPILSSIMDTVDPSSWLQNSFSNHEWSIIKDTSHFHYNQFQTSNCHLLKSGEIRDILNHL